MNNLKRLRAESDLSVRELAQLSTVPERSISRIENGLQKAQLNTLAKLAKALNSVLEPQGTKVKLEDFMELLDTSAAERGRASQRSQQEKKSRSTMLI